MSEVRVNKLSPRSGTTVTLGDSGDTITIPSGVTFDASSGGLAGTLTTAAQPNITSVGTLTSFTSTGIDDNATSTAITIDSSQNVTLAGDISAGNNGSLFILDSAGQKSGQITNDNSTSNSLQIDADPDNSASDSYTAFRIDNSEKMRINSSGVVSIGTTDSSGGWQVKVAGSNAPLELARTTGDTATRTQFGMEREGTFVGQFRTDGTDLMLQASAGALIFDTNGSNERMRITDAGNVGIGTSSPGTDFGKVLHISGASAATATTGGSRLFYTGTNGSGNWGVYDGTAGAYRAIIDSSGAVGIGTSTAISATNPVVINRSGNGTLILFQRGGGSEGSISVNLNTVSYNSFTGSHWSRFIDNSKPNILKGTVLESLDEMCDWYNLEFDITDEEGNITSKKIPHVLTDTQSNGDVITYNYEGTDYQATIVKEDDIKHMKSKVSDTVDAKNVYGVFFAYDEGDEGYNDFYVASVGSFVVRIKQGETIAKGDLLQSNGDGTAKVQTDDAVRSSSFAKVLSTTIIETYEDGSYLVPCSLMC